MSLEVSCTRGSETSTWGPSGFSSPSSTNHSLPRAGRGHCYDLARPPHFTVAMAHRWSGLSSAPAACYEWPPPSASPPASWGCPAFPDHCATSVLQLFIGFGFPYEGPAPLEAIANGCVFLQSRFSPPHSSLNHEFFRGKPTSREVSGEGLRWDPCRSWKGEMGQRGGGHLPFAQPGLADTGDASWLCALARCSPSTPTRRTSLASPTCGPSTTTTQRSLKQPSRPSWEPR